MRLGGAWLIAWTALGWLFFTGALLGIEGISEASVRTHITSTARVGVVIFLLAFVASSLRRVWIHPASAWLLRNRRYLGLSFALSHFVHLGGIVTLAPAVYFQSVGYVPIILALLGGIGLRLAVRWRRPVAAAA